MLVPRPPRPNEMGGGDLAAARLSSTHVVNNADGGGRVGSRTVRAASGLAVVVLAVAFAAAGAAAKPPAPEQPRDTATATGANLTLDNFSASAIDVDASSGPSGEDPQGTASFAVLGFHFSGPISCLKVTGNVAILEINGPLLLGVLSMIIRLTDNGGDGRDRFEYYPVLPEVGQDFDCQTGAPGWFGGPLIGRAVVVDAPPGPGSKADCRNGGWTRFGFKNQGLCVGAVAARADSSN